MRTLRGVRWNTGDDVALKHLEGGKAALLQAIEQRLLEEHPAHPAVKRCPGVAGSRGLRRQSSAGTVDIPGPVGR